MILIFLNLEYPEIMVLGALRPHTIFVWDLNSDTHKGNFSNKEWLLFLLSTGPVLSMGSAVID